MSLIASFIATFAATQTTSPQVTLRKAIPCISIKSTVRMEEVASVIQKSMPRLQEMLKEQRVVKSGPVFIRYNLVDMPNRLDVEVGVITPKKVKGKGEIFAGTIPAGKYITYDFYGHYSGLVGANGIVQNFAKEHALKFKMKRTKAGDEFVGRYEIYETDPETTPDPAKWLTRVVYRVE